MTVTPLTRASFGGRVDGVAIGPLSNCSVAPLLDALWAHKVLILRTGAVPSRADFHAFASSLGPLKRQFGSGVTYPSVAGHPELHLIQFDADHPPHLDIWHADHSWTEVPSDIEILLAEAVPPHGGDTIWADAAAAYRSLSPALQALARSVRCVHSLGECAGYADDRGATAIQRQQLQEAHPAVRHPCAPIHPFTGERLLYASDSFTCALDGLAPIEEAAIWPMLNAAAASNNSAQLRHSWQAGDVVLWDNLGLQHFAVADYFPATRRVLHASRIGTRSFGNAARE